MNWMRRGSDNPATDAERRQERLSAYLDGELTAEERAAVEMELAASEEAREALEDLQLVQAALRSLGIVPAPRSFAIAAAPARARGGLFARMELAIRAGAAGAALLFVVAIAGGGSLTIATPMSVSMDETATMAAPAASGAERSAVPGAAEAPAERDSDAELAPAAPMPDSAPVPESPPAPRPAPVPEAPAAAAPEDADGVPGEEALRAPEAVDDFGPGAPDRVAYAGESLGGATAALATLAVLLAALSGLLAWDRRRAG